MKSTRHSYAWLVFATHSAMGCGSAAVGSEANGAGAAGAGSDRAGSNAGSGGRSGSGSGGSTTAGSGGNTIAGAADASAGSNASAGAGALAGSSAGGAGAQGGTPAAQAGSDAAGPSTSASRLTPKPLGAGSGAPNGYLEYLPPGYDGSGEAPLLVFFHGIGQNGNGGSELLNITFHGPPNLIQNNHWPDSRPFVVLMPQYSGINGDIVPGGGCPSSAVINGFFDFALAHYKIDPKRTFLTGLSCGAVGSWDYLAEHQGLRIAAAVLIAGNPGDPTQASSAWKRAGCALGGAAVWSFHGDADDVVPYAPDHDTMQNLAACASPPRRSATFTTVLGGGHGIWGSIYDLSSGYGDIYGWLLMNAKP